MFLTKKNFTGNMKKSRTLALLIKKRAFVLHKAEFAVSLHLLYLNIYDRQKNHRTDNGHSQG